MLLKECEGCKYLLKAIGIGAGVSAESGYKFVRQVPFIDSNIHFNGF